MYLGAQKGVIIAANDDDTFLDPAGSPYGSVWSPFGCHVGSNVVQLSPKWGCLGAQKGVIIVHLARIVGSL